MSIVPLTIRYENTNISWALKYQRKEISQQYFQLMGNATGECEHLDNPLWLLGATKNFVCVCVNVVYIELKKNL